MLTYGALITVIGMGAVFAFLFLLMWTIQVASYIIQKATPKNDLNKIAAVIAVALKNGGK